MKHAAPAFGNAAGTLPDLSILARYDTLLLIDDSGSMAGARWTHLRQALMDVVQRIVGAQESAAASMAGNAAGGGADGVQIAFLNSAVEGFNLTVSLEVGPFRGDREGSANAWSRRTGRDGARAHGTLNVVEASFRREDVQAGREARVQRRARHNFFRVNRHGLYPKACSIERSSVGLTVLGRDVQDTRKGIRVYVKGRATVRYHRVPGK